MGLRSTVTPGTSIHQSNRGLRQRTFINPAGSRDLQRRNTRPGPGADVGAAKPLASSVRAKPSRPLVTPEIQRAREVLINQQNYTQAEYDAASKRIDRFNAEAYNFAQNDAAYNAEISAFNSQMKDYNRAYRAAKRKPRKN